MKVAVTGGTGFVGSHTVAALTGAGHDVRLLVRSPEKVERAMEPHGIQPADIIVGDVTDPGSIDVLLEGADALIHAANVFTFDVRHTDEMKRVNEEGTELVLSSAAKLGLDPVVHVSSTVAFLPANKPINEDTPTGDPAPAYAATKATALGLSGYQGKLPDLSQDGLIGLGGAYQVWLERVSARAMMSSHIS